MKSSGLRSTVLAVASALLVSGLPSTAYAAGLGRLSVFSALGQPLRAEIEVTATREELADMKARLASQETFKQAGLDYASSLLDIRFNLEKRPNGNAVIKLSSSRPINEPFLDMLLQLDWSSGRLVREYTFLLDPPEYAAKSPTAVAPATVNVPVSRTTAPVVRTAPPSGAAIDADVRARAVAQVRGQQNMAQSAPQSTPSTKKDEAAARAGTEHEVKRGETLHQVATAMKPAGVSLDQMLVGLLRANPQAFDGGNMNRLKTGAILSIPDKSTLESISQNEAKKTVMAQSANWNAYRSKLGGVAAKSSAQEEAGRQDASGKITAKVDDAAEPAAPKDQLKVSRAESSGKGGASARDSKEDLVAKDKALKEANERVAALEKTVADMQRLLALQNQSMAELQKQAAMPGNAAPAATVVASSPKPAEPPKSVEVSKPVETPKPAEASPAAPPAAPIAEATPAKTDMPQPTEAKPAEPPTPKPAPKPVPKPQAPPPPPPEPSFFEDLLNNPMALLGGGGILALVAGFLFMRRRRAMAEESQLDLNSTLTPHTTTGLTTNSVFRDTGGQSVDTSSQAPLQTDFSQAGPGSIDTDEVDPVAEADVYMAYGRDAQAEEILLEARQKDPARAAITVKLLEIYSGRKDVKQFETLATELYGETGGAGPNWEKAAAMGRILNPNNPIFRGGISTSSAGLPEQIEAPQQNAPASAMPTAAAAAGLATAAAINVSPISGSSQSDGVASLTSGAAAGAQISGEKKPSSEPLDFNLGEEAAPLPKSQAPVQPSSVKEPALQAGTAPEAPVKLPDLDFDIGTKIASPGMETTDRNMADLALADLDFDLGIDHELPAGSAAQADQAETRVWDQPAGEDNVEFDVSLTESTFLGRLPSEPQPFNMASIDLDLQVPDLEIAPEALSITQTMPRQAMPPAPAPGVPSQKAPVFEGVQVSTAVNPEFSTEQLETMVTPPGFESEQNATAVNADFSVGQMETLVSPAGTPMSQAETALNFELSDRQSENFSSEMGVASNDEVTTKLDLAKAYEEMGDVEGARELLQEVLREGNISQKEAAQAMLTRVGG